MKNQWKLKTWLCIYCTNSACIISFEKFVTKGVFIILTIKNYDVNARYLAVLPSKFELSLVKFCWLKWMATILLAFGLISSLAPYEPMQIQKQKFRGYLLQVKRISSNTIPTKAKILLKYSAVFIMSVLVKTQQIIHTNVEEYSNNCRGVIRITNGVKTHLGIKLLCCSSSAVFIPKANYWRYEHWCTKTMVLMGNMK